MKNNLLVIIANMLFVNSLRNIYILICAFFQYKTKKYILTILSLTQDDLTCFQEQFFQINKIINNFDGKLKINNIIDYMGCGPQAKVPSLVRADSLIGVLKVTVVDAQFPQEAELKEPSLKIRVSNQQFATKSLSANQKIHKVNESFNFSINSFYKGEGRVIEAGVFDGPTFVAYGAVDANPLITSTSKGDPHEFRVILASDKQKKFGYTTLQATFEELPSNQITFRFESATIRRKHGDSKVSVRLTIGEEQLQTDFKEDILESPPIWKDQMLNYKIPQGVTKGLLQLINGKQKEIGSTWLDLTKLLESKPGDQVFVAEQLFFKSQDQEVDAANLKYSYIAGEKASFSQIQIQDILRSSVRGIKARNEIDQPILERGK